MGESVTCLRKTLLLILLLLFPPYVSLLSFVPVVYASPVVTITTGINGESTALEQGRHVFRNTRGLKYYYAFVCDSANGKIFLYKSSDGSSWSACSPGEISGGTNDAFDFVLYDDGSQMVIYVVFGYATVDEVIYYRRLTIADSASDPTIGALTEVTSGAGKDTGKRRSPTIIQDRNGYVLIAYLQWEDPTYYNVYVIGTTTTNPGDSPTFSTEVLVESTTISNYYDARTAMVSFGGSGDIGGIIYSFATTADQMKVRGRDITSFDGTTISLGTSADISDGYGTHQHYPFIAVNDSSNYAHVLYDDPSGSYAGTRSKKSSSASTVEAWDSNIQVDSTEPQSLSLSIVGSNLYAFYHHGTTNVRYKTSPVGTISWSGENTITESADLDYLSSSYREYESNLHLVWTQTASPYNVRYEELSLGEFYTRQGNATLTVSEERTQLSTFTRILSQPLTINNIASTIGSFFRSLAQSISLSGIASALQIHQIDVSQTLNVGNLAFSLFVGVRNVFQSLTTNNVASKLGTFVRATYQQLSFQTQATSGLFFSRDAFGTLNVGSTVSIVFTNVRNVFQSLSFSSVTIQLNSFIRKGLQALTVLTSIESLILYAPAIDVVTVLPPMRRTLTSPRTATSPLSIVTFISQLSQKIRNIFQSLTVNTSVARILAFVRAIFQSVSVAGFSSRILYAFRVLLQGLTIGNVAESVYTPLIIRNAFQSLSISDFSDRVFSGVTKIFQSVSVGAFTTRMLTALRTGSQSLTLLTAVVAEQVFVYYRNAFVSLNFNVLSSRLLYATRQMPQSFTINALHTSFATLFRATFQSFSISTFTQSAKIFLRQATQSVSMSAFPLRVFTGIRTLFQGVSISAIATSQYIPAAQSYEREAFGSLSLSVSTIVAKVYSVTVFQALDVSTLATRVYRIVRLVQQQLVIENIRIRWISVSVIVTQALTTTTQTSRTLIAPVVYATQAYVLSIALAFGGIGIVALALALIAIHNKQEEE